MAEKIIMAPEGRATVPPELVAYYVREFRELNADSPEDAWSVWGYVWDQLAADADWDTQLTKLGLAK